MYTVNGITDSLLAVVNIAIQCLYLKQTWRFRSDLNQVKGHLQVLSTVQIGAESFSPIVHSIRSIHNLSAWWFASCWTGNTNICIIIFILYRREWRITPIVVARGESSVHTPRSTQDGTDCREQREYFQWLSLLHDSIQNQLRNWGVWRESINWARSNTNRLDTLTCVDSKRKALKTHLNYCKRHARKTSPIV